MKPEVVDRNAPDRESDLALDRSHFSVARLEDPGDALAYWLSRPFQERLEALELLRRTFYGYTGAGPRLQTEQASFRTRQRRAPLEDLPRISLPNDQRSGGFKANSIPDHKLQKEANSLDPLN